MARPKPAIEALEDWVLVCVRNRAGGLSWKDLKSEYKPLANRGERTARQDLHVVRMAVAEGKLDRVGVFHGPKGLIFGSMKDSLFLQAKEDAERPPPTDRPQATLQLGGLFQESEVRSEWTNCPVTNRLVRTNVLTVGFGDFMECSICYRFHFLGVSPNRQHQRVYAWQIDPLVCALDYEDELSCSLIVDPKTGRTQESRISRVRNGGRYIGLRYRGSWDYDPRTLKGKALLPWKGPKPTVPIRMPLGGSSMAPLAVRHESLEVAESELRKRKRGPSRKRRTT